MFKSIFKLLSRTRHKDTTESNSSNLNSENVTNPDGPGDIDYLDINLGIDFGTSFTKVCFRDVAEETSGIINFGVGDLDDAMIPSVVGVDNDGNLCLSQHQTNGDNVIAVIPYLKMLLADISLPVSLPEKIFDGSDHRLKIAALTSWFLYQTMVQSRDWILLHESDRCKGRKINWSANICVPVEICDSPKKDVFQEVADVAWHWFMSESRQSTFPELMRSFSELRQEITERTSDCHVIEEVAAAVQSFLNTRSARGGAYIYLDIGGGTIDGVAFLFKLDKINCLSAAVKPIGVSSISQKLANKLNIDPLEVENYFFDNAVDPQEFENELFRYKRKIQKLVGSVIINGKKKDPSDWRRGMENLPVFVAGGGSRSLWFRNSIKTTYEDFQQENAAIPPYQVSEIPIPNDFAFNGLPEGDFNRFSVAYGLSIPFGTTHEIGLPSAITPPSPNIQPPTKPAYLDTKELT